MALAFELPEHLPRSSHAQDKSTAILSKIGQTNDQPLNAALAASWLAELDATIYDTKSRISGRIHEDLPTFERQLKSSTVVQTRLHDLSRSIDHLNESLNGPDTGILPALLRTLSAHGTLAAQASDSEVTHRALAHLLHMQEELAALSAFVQRGELPEAAEASRRIQDLVAAAPNPVGRAEIMPDIKKRHRTLNDRVQEQIGDAYDRSFVFSTSSDSSSLTARGSTTVTPTSTQITPAAILRSFSLDALSTRLSTLRRDIMSKFVEPVLLSNRSLLPSTGEGSHTLTLVSTPSPNSQLQSLQTLNAFLEHNIFAHLPPTQAAFPTTFHNPITTAILTHLLKSSIPSSLTVLPPFLQMVDHAVRFEEALLPSDARDRPIRNWADDVAGHYERRRREDVMQYLRQVLGKQEEGTAVRIEVPLKQMEELQVQGPESELEADVDESGWDFEADAPEEDVIAISGSESNGSPQASSKNTRKEGSKVSDEDNTSDEWGWGEADDADVDVASSSSPPKDISPQSPEDDPWGDDGWDTQPATEPEPEPEPTPAQSTSQRTPKLAKRLEKLSAKAKGLSASNTPAASPSVSIAPKPDPPSPQPPRTRPAPLKPKRIEKETYLVSSWATTTLSIAESLLSEGRELLSSNILSGHRSATSAPPGNLLISAAPLVLDLHRALYPVAHAHVLARDADVAMRWANDCRFLSDQAADLRSKDLAHTEDKWGETSVRLKVLGETSFEDAVVRQQQAVKAILLGARGFVQVTDAQRFEECRNTVEQVYREITSIAHKWKLTLSKSAYLDAIGQIVDDALFRVMDDVMSLVDIPEADSERLSDLCEMLTSLEDLFADAPGEQSVVGSHVPLWFKFSYLSWLIKGSIADISYLFDQGMLVDYEVDELVRLLRALFAETPLRENTIAKVSRGHPVAVHRDDF